MTNKLDSKAISTQRWLSCGHVDDGKSTLIGRLWHAMGAVPKDTLQHAKDEDGKVDYAKLLDGLEDEQSQGITIDVAWRFARYKGKHWILADTPGHQQYTHNMAVAASYSDGALLVLDAQHGVRDQTKRHSAILDFFAVPSRLVLVNKMDLVNYNEERFKQIESDVASLFNKEKYQSINVIPVSALHGDNVATPSAQTTWYKGPTVLQALETLNKRPLALTGSMLSVQHMSKAGSRIYYGSLIGDANGEGLSMGQRLWNVSNPNISAKVTGLWRSGDPVDVVQNNDSIALSLDTELDLARGSVLATKADLVQLSETASAKVIWLKPELAKLEQWHGIMKIRHQETSVAISLLDMEGVINHTDIEAATPLAFVPGLIPECSNSFILIDPETFHSVGVGFIEKVGLHGSKMGFGL